jgi:hypothetical protein
MNRAVHCASLGGTPYTAIRPGLPQACSVRAQFIRVPDRRRVAGLEHVVCGCAWCGVCVERMCQDSMPLGIF